MAKRVMPHLVSSIVGAQPMLKLRRGLLEKPTVRHFYIESKTVLHKATLNSGINIIFFNVYINIIYNCYRKDYSLKQTVFKKQEFFF